MAPHATVSDQDIIVSSVEDPALAISDEAVSASPDLQTRVVPFRRDVLVLINVWLVFHLFAILVCPASVEPSSPLAQTCFSHVSWYLHALYLDHGFHFFAPDPGASTLVAFKLEFADGTTQSGRIPDRATFPRLLYHRYFMLTEFLGNGPEDAQPFVERALARNLCRHTGAIRVSLTKVMHEIPTQEQVRAGRNLNDPSLFVESSLGTYTADELRLPFKYAVDQITESDLHLKADAGVAASGDAPENVHGETKVSR